MSQDLSRRKFMTGAAVVGAAAAIGGLAACSSGESESTIPSSSSSSSTSSSSEAASAAVPDPTKEILVTSFGTSYASSRYVTIGAVESAIREFFPDWTQARAFTAQIIIDHIEEDTGVHINNFKEALDQAIANGVTTLVVQPTHLMSGNEYSDVLNELTEYEDQFEQVAIGQPLCASADDQTIVAQACIDDTADYDDGDTAIVYMGHGTDNESNSLYATMQDVFTSLGAENYYVGTVEASPSLDDVLSAISEQDYSRVVLQPMMVVAGDHANNDMADPDDPESWYSTFSDAGYEVVTRLVGLGSLQAIDDLYVVHAQAAIDTLA